MVSTDTFDIKIISANNLLNKKNQRDDINELFKENPAIGIFRRFKLQK
jgi:hypothetical protein